MSHRIFINTLNDQFDKIVKTSKVNSFGLGVPTELDEEERISLQQKSYEIYFTSDELREKRRKLNVVIDSFLDSKFWAGSGQYLGDENSLISAPLVEAITNNMPENRRYLLPTITNAIVEGATTYTAILNRDIPEFSRGDFTQRIDNAAPWKMTRPDFPNITGQAIQGSSNRRAIVRLYDDRGGALFGIGLKNVSTEEAIALLVRESLADALYCKTASPNGITPPEHPGPGGNGDQDRWINKNALRDYFPFRHVNSGTDRAVRTYINALDYLLNYVDLIDKILNLQDRTLSRSPDIDEAEIRIPIKINLSTATINLFDALASTAQQVVREKVLTFFDENREYKTLLNFGNDRQYVAEAWRIAPSDSESIQLKLLQPLGSDIALDARAFISRELAQSVIDSVVFDLGPAADTTPYLRPYNMDSRNYVDNKMFSSNTTLVSLGLATGSAGAVVNGSSISYEDAVFRRWFTGDFKSSELNVDFTNYNKFVHFGSAYKRLQAFNEKLLKIEELTSASISSSVSSSIATLLFKAREKENIIRNFDPYEQFLYYATESIAYSASAFYTTNEIEYNSTGSWPKLSDGSPVSPNNTIAVNWLSVQSAIAQRYDDNNSNRIITNLPEYIQNDINSNDFLTLFDMIGHLMDNIKVYADQFPNIYSTNPNPLQDLTMDQVYEVAQSFGLQLPNVYALENLQSFNAQFTGESGSRSYVSETWKRFLHSMVYFAKTKGSRTSLDALLNTYGINSPVLQIKETSYPIAGNYIRSDELTYGLQFTGSVANRVQIPFVSSSITASSLQLSFNPNKIQSSSLVTGDTWAIDLVPHPSASKVEYGRIHVVSGSARTIIATSSYFPLFSDDYTNLMLRSQSGDISIIQTDGDQILFKESASVNLSSLWNNTTFIYVGGSGSIKLSNNFDGIVDEVRLWGENISNEDFESQAYDPGSYYGTSYTSSYVNLYVHVPFSQPLASITSYVTNESPYQNVSIVSTLPAVGFTTASFTKVLRSIKQFTPIVGSTVYTNKNITIVPPPIFNQEFVDSDGTRVLNRLKSIKTIEEKQYDSSQNVVSFAVSPTDFVNQNIIRSMGVVDVNNIIGSPRYITGSGYTSLETVKKDYLEYFNKTINPNEYIRFFKDLIQGPSEVAETMVPARAKLQDGIVIESSVLSRNKQSAYRKFAIDGTGTIQLNKFISGSGSANIGAYSFEVMPNTASLLPSSFGDTLLLNADIDMPATVTVVSSTRPTKLPAYQRVIQKINFTNIETGSYSYATSSIFDENSYFATLEALSIDAAPRGDITSSGYARNPYLGIQARFSSEDNTTLPFYNIPPRSDLGEVGTTSYFHKSSGIYFYDIYTLYKTEYKVKLDTATDSPLDRLYAPITLLPTGSIVSVYGRDTTTIPSTRYGAGGQAFGVIKLANIFSVYRIIGQPGLRIRMYASPSHQTADASRGFNTIPSVTAGVLFDGLLNGVQDVFPYVMMQTSGANIYYTIDNLTNTEIGSSVTIDYFSYEPDIVAPVGYLPRHYKFSRDNTIALKRRNYLGCRDINFTFDNQSPFSVSISAQNTVIVNNTTTPSAGGAGGTVEIPDQIDTITFGGGGRLNVE